MTGLDIYEVNHLPDHILVDIFQYLDAKDKIKIGRVCKRWHRVVKDKYLWRNVNMSPYALSKVTFTKVARRYFNDLTRELKFRGTWRRASKNSGYVVSDNVLNTLAKSTNKLTKIEIEDENFEDSKLSLLPDSLEDISFISCEIPVKSFLNIESSFPLLTTLVFRGCSGITDKQLACLGRRPILKRLECYGCYRLDDDAVNVICKNFVNLTTLVMIGCPHCGDSACSNIAESLNNLEVLEIEEWVDVSERGFEKLKQMKGMTFLSIKCRQFLNGKIFIQGSRLF